MLDEDELDVIELVDMVEIEYCLLDTQQLVDIKYSEDVNILVEIIQYIALRVIDA